ncbi:transcriptional regulator FtrA [Dyella tabacisoli]|uniref:Transcriptional regulator FtrA n=1 Tax=Dyella tabacisoli TaxID=2282381 RepID=A0A369UMN2_9GAMM|nr:transcriptional regulator FtrA [Dyella tabacisoli]RDD80850.1 transcriptional regulator FtrA [Dyella tabacisoli]
MKKPPKRSRTRPSTLRPGPSNRQVAVLVYDGLCTFEFGIAVEMFGMPRPEIADWYDFVLCPVDHGPMRAAGGWCLSIDGVPARRDLETLAQAGTIIVPGWRGVDAAPSPALLDALRAAHARGARLLSYCSGVFVLAATGLLDGRCATTHWRYVQALAERYPRIRIEPDVLYVDEGNLLTSAGSAAALDLSLHLIRRDYGPQIANQVARRAVVPTHRDGGQAQFIPAPLPEQGASLGTLLEWMRRRLDQPLPLSLLAERAKMSERTLLRRFEEATGNTPKQWLTRERLNRACELLESGNMPIERIADTCGFGSADTLRHHFRRTLQVSPLRYRERFGG